MYIEHSKPLEQYTTEELYNHFHFGNADIKYIAETSTEIPKESQSVEDRSSLRCASMHLQFSTKFLIGGDKSTMSDVVKAVSIELASLVHQFVSLPKDDQIVQTKHKLFLLGKIPKYNWNY